MSYFTLTNNYTLASQNEIVNNTTNNSENNLTNSEIEENIINKFKIKGLETRKQNYLHEDNFNYDNIHHINRLRNEKISLTELLSNFSIEKPLKVRYTSLPMVNTHNTRELDSRRKLHTLLHVNNESKDSNSHTLSRIYRNKNLRHSNSYHTIPLEGNDQYERRGNALIYKNQSLNRELKQKLYSNNGGNFRNKISQENFVITSNINHPLTGIFKKKIHHEINKHPRSAIGRLKIF